MKNYIIGLLLIVILVLFSYGYKNRHNSVFQGFPVEKVEGHLGDHPTLHLFMFFSGDDCSNCLEVIDVLNNLPSQFKVTGIVPKMDMANMGELREKTRARFDLQRLNKSHMKFYPKYSPSILVVGENGKVYCVIPGVPGERRYFEEFLINLYGRLLPLLIQE